MATAEPAPAFVGREVELRCLRAALDTVARRSPCAITVSGEPGIGKTRLLSELGALAAQHDHLVLLGRAAEFERDLPFGVFVDALDEHVRGLGAHKLHRLGSELVTELSQLFPALSGMIGAEVPLLQIERYRAHRAVRELLERLAASRPLVLLLDDLHWADHASIELLSALLRRPPNAGVLLAMSLRPHQADVRLVSALENASREGLLERLDLRPLTQAESDLMLPAALRSTVRSTLHALAGGNPFYLEELARSERRATRLAAGAHHSNDPLAGADAEIPPAVAAALAQEISLLDAASRSFLEGGAVAGDPFELELAAAAAELPEGRARAALDALLASDLVRSTDLPRRFRFRHPLLRAAVYGAARAGWRLGAHERIARALAARGERASARAHHVEQFARVGDADAIALLAEAGAAAAQRAPASAARWFAAALRLLPEAGGRPEQRVELSAALADSLAAVGRLEESRSTLLALLEQVPAEATALRTRLIGACATIEDLLGRHADAGARLRRALGQLSDRSSPEAVALELELAINAFYKGDYARMREYAEHALARGRALDERALTAAATATVALASTFVGDIADGRAHAEDAAQLLDALSDAELATRLDAPCYLAWAGLYLERYGESLRHSARGIAVVRATGQGQFLPQMIQAQAGSTVLSGRLAEAAENEERAVEAARLTGNPQSLIWALMNYAHAMVARDATIALRAAEESVELMHGLEDNAIFTMARSVHAMVLGELGDCERCAVGLLAAAGGIGLPAIPPTWRPFFYDVLTRAELELGRVDAGDEAAAQAEDLAHGLGMKLPQGWAQRARARVLLAAGDRHAAADLALASAAGAAAVGAHVEVARSWALCGTALLDAGERERALAKLQAAAAQFDSCGANRLRDEVERELRRLGRRFQRRAPRGDRGVGALSAREFEIAQLVTARKTNREIAAELFLSEKTVETHLRNIFGKLGVSSRRAVAHALEQVRQPAPGSPISGPRDW